MLSLPKMIATVLLAAASVSAQRMFQVGEPEPFNVAVTAGGSRSDYIAYPGATYVAVHFADFQLPEGDKVIVRDPENSVAYEYTGLGRGAAGKSGGFYATYIPGSAAVVEYQSSGIEASGDFGYTIDRFAHGIDTSSPTESICGKDDSKPSVCYKNDTTLPQAYDKSRAVARLLIDGEGACTGWLVGSEGHMLTNHHCITEAATAKLIDFDFTAEDASCEEDKCQDFGACPGKIVATEAEFIANNEENDWALIKLPLDVVSSFGYLQLRAGGPQLNETIYVPQHPAGWGKRIASLFDDGTPSQVTNLDSPSLCGQDQVGYNADTQPGSSGSPVLSTHDNTVVALHHCGGCTSEGGENAAINIQKVIDDFRTNNITIANLLANGGAAPVPAPTATTVPSVSPSPVPSPSPSPSPVTRSTIKPKDCTVHVTKTQCKKNQCYWYGSTTHGFCGQKKKN